MSAEEKLQSMVVELRTLESYYNEVATRESLVTRMLLESKGALDALKSLPEDGTSDVIVPVGGGVLIHASVPAPEKLIVSVGADVALEKTRMDAQSYVEERVGELQRAVSNLGAQRNELTTKMEVMRAQVNKFAQSLKRS